MSRNLRSATPAWASKIAALRQSLNLSQQEFGSLLGTSAMSVSRWERGEMEPSAGACIGLGRIAGPPLCWYFWDRAGLSITDVKHVLASAREVGGGTFEQGKHGNLSSLAR